MPAEASILAVGPFRKDLVPHLEAMPRDYENMKPGQPLATEFFSTRTTGSSIELAYTLGANLHDPATHNLQPGNVDRFLVAARHLDANEELTKGLDGDLGDQVEALRAFRRAGFTFFLRVS